MSALSAGRSTNCTGGTASGGIADDLYLANANEVTSIQQDADGKCTGITMVTDKVFYAFDFRDFSARFQEPLTKDPTTGAVQVDQTFEMIWPSRNHADRNSIMDMANQDCGMVAIHIENTGVAWIWGYKSKQRCKLRTATGDSGAALTDPNQETLTIGCFSQEKAVEFTPGQAGIPLS